MSETFLWYDLETFGRDPRRTRIAQFAAVRTNLDLEPSPSRSLCFANRPRTCSPRPKPR